MARVQDDGNHEYLVIPDNGGLSEYNTTSTYDQFIQLRDTLVFTGKQYSGKAGLKLCVGDKEDTIEVAERQYWRQAFEPGYESDSSKITTLSVGKYVNKGTTSEGVAYPELTCTIQRDGHYRISHKQEICNLDSSISKIYCYILHHAQKYNDTTHQIEWAEIPRAVFDWEGGGTLSGTTSGTQPNGSCSVSFTIGQLFNKVTTFGYIEADFKKGDWLEMRMDKQSEGHIDSSTFMQENSNWWSVEYIDLPYNN